MTDTPSTHSRVLRTAMRDLMELREAIVGERPVWRGDYERWDAIRIELLRLQRIEEQYEALDTAVRYFFLQWDRHFAEYLDDFIEAALVDLRALIVGRSGAAVPAGGRGRQIATQETGSRPDTPSLPVSYPATASELESPSTKSEGAVVSVTPAGSEAVVQVAPQPRGEAEGSAPSGRPAPSPTSEGAALSSAGADLPPDSSPAKREP